MTAVYPAGTKVQGNIKLQAVVAIADTSAPDLSSEINAVTSLDISCYVTADGWQPGGEENIGAAPRRLCSTVERDQLGNVKYTLQPLVYAVDPKGAVGSDGRKAYETLVPRTTIWIVERLGYHATDVDWAADQWVNLWPVTLGIRQPITGDVTSEFSEFTCRQALVVAGSGVPIEHVKLVA